MAALWPGAAPPIRENDFLSASQAALKGENFPLAHRILDEGFGRYPGSRKLHARAFELAVAEGDRAAQRRLANTFLEHRSWSVTTGSMLADYLIDEKQFNEARLVLRSLIATQPDNEELEEE